MGAQQNVSTFQDGVIQCNPAMNQHTGYILSSTKYNIDKKYETQGTCVAMYLFHKTLKPLHTNINIHQTHTIM